MFEEKNKLAKEENQNRRGKAPGESQNLRGCNGSSHLLPWRNIETTLKCAVRSLDDFAIWYTPGVAAPCRAIEETPDLGVRISR